MVNQNSVTLRPGTLGNLTAVQKERYVELERALAEDPAPFVETHLREDRRRRLLRHLCATDFEVIDAKDSIHEQAAAWRTYNMDAFVEEDELCENGPMYVCGEDRWGRPVIIARPCQFVSTGVEHSVTTARQCAYTAQCAIDRMGPGISQYLIIYDCLGTSRRNFDKTFTREIVACFDPLFHDRMARCVVINLHWSLFLVWKAIRPLLPRQTRENVLIYSKDYLGPLEAHLPADHPYLSYSIAVHGLPQCERQQYPVPPRTPFISRWRESVLADANLPFHVEDGATSRGNVEVDSENRRSVSMDSSIVGASFGASGSNFKDGDGDLEIALVSYAANHAGAEPLNNHTDAPPVTNSMQDRLVPRQSAREVACVVDPLWCRRLQWKWIGLFLFLLMIGFGILVLMLLHNTAASI